MGDKVGLNNIQIVELQPESWIVICKRVGIGTPVGPNVGSTSWSRQLGLNQSEHRTLELAHGPIKPSNTASCDLNNETKLVVRTPDTEVRLVVRIPDTAKRMGWDLIEAYLLDLTPGHSPHHITSWAIDPNQSNSWDPNVASSVTRHQDLDQSQSSLECANSISWLTRTSGDLDQSQVTRNAKKLVLRSQGDVQSDLSPGILMNKYWNMEEDTQSSKLTLQPYTSKHYTPTSQLAVKKK